MAKAVLIMEMPERCDKCNLFLAVKQKNLGLCLAKQSSGETNTEYNPKHEASWRPDWCPLREPPEKKVADKRLAISPLTEGQLNDFEKGWNACLDVIDEK